MRTRYRVTATTILLLTLFATALAASAQTGQYQPFGTSEFENVWERTDYPVEQQVEARTWIWGPGANSGLLQEDYAEASGGARTVQYTDKSRMEMPVGGGDPDSAWLITQGLLAKELMTGELQLGDASFEQHSPASIPAAGDHNNNPGPTYDDMGDLMRENARPAGNAITELIAPSGTVTSAGSLANYGVTDDYYISQTDHTIASVFWEFMNSTGTIYENGSFAQGDIFANPFYAVGYPLTEAYWGEVRLGGTLQNVLIQCFERRCLTYAPGNPSGWKVESGNIGQHYYEWRYNTIGSSPPGPDVDNVQLSFDPGATNSVDDDVMLIALVEDQDGDPVEGVNIVFESDRQGQIDTVETDGSGRAIVSDHHHQTAESETITATEQANGNQDSEALTWNPGDPDSITLERFENPSGRFTLVGELRGVLATVTDRHGNQLEGVSVSFSIPHLAGEPTTGNHWTWYPDNGGIDQSSQQINSTNRETNERGVVGFDYRSRENGRHQIVASVDSEPISEVHNELWCNEIVEDRESIQDALNHVGRNEYVCVQPGTYPELIQIDTYNVFLIGSGVGESIIDAPLPGGQSPEPAITISADDALISDFTVTQAGEQQHPVVGIDGGMRYTQLFDLDVSAPDFDASDTPAHAIPSHIIGHRDFNQPIGGIDVVDVTADRAIGLRLMDGAHARVQRNTVTASNSAGIWIDWDGSGSAKVTENTYEGSVSEEQIILYDSPDGLNDESPNDQEAAEMLVCDNNIDGAVVNGTNAYSCP